MRRGSDDDREGRTAARHIRQLLMARERADLERIQGKRIVRGASLRELERLRAVLLELSTWLDVDAPRAKWERLEGLEFALECLEAQDAATPAPPGSEEPSARSKEPSADVLAAPERLDRPAAGPAPLPSSEEPQPEAPVAAQPGTPPPSSREVPHLGMSADEAVARAKRAAPSSAGLDADPPAPLRPPAPPAPPAPSVPPESGSPPPPPPSGASSSSPPGRDRAGTVAVLPNAAVLGALPFMHRQDAAPPPQVPLDELLDESGETAPGLEAGAPVQPDAPARDVSRAEDEPPAGVRARPNDATVALHVPPPPSQAHPFAGRSGGGGPVAQEGDDATSQFAFGSAALPLAIGIDEHATLAALEERDPRAAQEMAAACGITSQAERHTVDRMVDSLCEAIAPLKTAWERSYARAIAALDDRA